MREIFQQNSQFPFTPSTNVQNLVDKKEKEKIMLNGNQSKKSSKHLQIRVTKRNGMAGGGVDTPLEVELHGVGGPKFRYPILSHSSFINS